MSIQKKFIPLWTNSGKKITTNLTKFLPVLIVTKVKLLNFIKSGIINNNSHGRVRISERSPKGGARLCFSHANMAIKKEQIHGFWLTYEEELRDGVRYLRDDLQHAEAKTLFDAARVDGVSEFEDDQDRDWTLIYNRQEGNYTLIRRQRE